MDRDTIVLGETALLTLVFEGASPSGVPAMPEVPGLTIQFYGQSQQFQILGGQRTTQVLLQFYVKASKPGEYIIPPMVARMGSQDVTTQPLKLKVLKPEEAGSAYDKTAFVRLLVPKKTVYLRENFAVEIQWFWQSGSDHRMPQLKADGFTMGQPIKQSLGRTQIGNTIYQVMTFKLTASAVKTGSLTLGPAECSFVLLTPGRGLGAFLGDFDQRPVTLTSDTQTIQVRPLPEENKPPEFNGAVGTFSWSVTATPTNLTLGDPISLKVQIAGSGSLDTLPFPPQDGWTAFKLYPPSSSIQTTDPLGLSGAKTFEQVIIPQDPAISRLPVLSFSFFDPAKKSYQTLRSPTIPLQVRAPSGNAPQPTVLAGKNGQETGTEPPPRDIVHIKPHLGTMVSLRPPVVTRLWFLLFQLAPLLAWVAVVLWRKRQENLQRNPRLLRRQHVQRLLRSGLEELAQAAAQNRPDDFFATVFRLLQEQLGERLNRPASAITEAVVDEELHVGSPELLASLHRLFQMCNQARYARQRSSQELLSIVPEVECALRGLQHLPDLSMRRRGALPVSNPGGNT